MTDATDILARDEALEDHRAHFAHVEEMAKLTADPARLDRLEAWMRDDGVTVRHSSDGFHIFYRGQALACNQSSLRAAIDAARKQDA